MMRELALFLCCLSLTRARAQPPDLTVELSAAVGQVQTPYYTRPFPHAKSEIGQSRLLGLRMNAALPRDLRAELCLTAAHVGVAQPAGSYRFTWITSHLSLALDAPLFERGPHALSFGGRLALPLHGELGASQMKQRAYALANGLTAFAEQLMFTPGTVGAAPYARWDATFPHGALLVAFELPLLVRFSDVRLPSAATRTLGTSPVVWLGGEVAPIRRLTAGMRLAAVGNWRGPTRDARSDRGQALLVPSLTLRRRRERAPDATLRAHVPLFGIVERTFQLAILLHWDLAWGGT
jgi:hypothetical protein